MSPLYIQVMDKDTCDDDIVGKVKIPLAHLCLPKVTATEQEFDLYFEKKEDKRKLAGTIKLRFLFRSQTQLKDKKDSQR